jgi:cellulose synthase/poly-beta-1,6-N-acetylglucosamine synthase-like glycosyltransferase
MVDSLTIIYLGYSFVAFYFLFLYLTIYVRNRKDFYFSPPIKKDYSLSIVVPCYNEEGVIGETIEAILNSDYKNLKKVIVVDDCSTDGSWEVIKSYAKKYDRVVAAQTPKNTGKASGSKNYGAKFVDTDLIGFVDADSFPKKEAIRKAIGFFNNPKVGAVTTSVLVKKRTNLIEKLQSIEYKVIVFTRKILGFVDAIYVTPGPLAIYRKKAFDEVNGFDEKNLTEDIEITWHLVSKGWKIEMSIPSRVYTVAPNKLKQWYSQRIRWNVGGIQTMDKYKKTFLKSGMLGSFIIPFFIFSWIIGLVGIGVMGYRIFQRFLVDYLSTKYSIGAQTAVLALREINLTPNALLFFGTAILISSLFFTFLSLFHTREKEFKRPGLFNVIVFALIYLLAYPIILIVSMWRFVRGKKVW